MILKFLKSKFKIKPKSLIALGFMALAPMLVVGAFVVKSKSASDTQNVNPLIEQSEEFKDAIKIRDTDKIFGDKDAKNTMIVYDSFSCMHCAKFYNEIMPMLIKNFIADGNLKFIHRDFPLNQNAADVKSIIDCVTDGKGDGEYYRIVRFYYYKFDIINSSQDPAMKTKKIFKAGGINADECKTDLNIKDAFDEIRSEVSALGVQGTPAIFINGKRYQGKGSIQDLIDYINLL